MDESYHKSTIVRVIFLLPFALELDILALVLGRIRPIVGIKKLIKGSPGVPFMALKPFQRHNVCPPES